MKAASLLLAFLCAGASSAQSTEAALTTRLVHQPLYLRALISAPKLHFDASGKLKSHADPVPFTLAGFEVDSLSLEKKKLVLQGHPAGIEFQPKDSDAIRVVLHREARDGSITDLRMRVEIDAPPGGDYTPVLDAIFTNHLPDLIPTLPEIWQKWAQQYLADGAEVYTQQAPDPKQKVFRVGGNITPPRVLHQPEPRFSEAAREMRYSGNVRVYLHVDKDGMPQEIRLLRPAGLGMDENAVEAVRGYRFQPALESGKPVQIEMQVEVNFQIY